MTTRKLTRRVFTGACLAAPLTAWANAFAAPALMHANTYNDRLVNDLTDFWVSEKLDGVRAFWDGTRLVTRAGNAIAAPRWFVDRLPSIALDGELWGGRDTFEHTSGIVRASTPQDASWRALKYMLFDLPHEQGNFDARLRKLNAVTSTTRIAWLEPVAQTRVGDSQQLHTKLREVEALGGEGLMLHRASSLYIAGRSDDLLKFKSFADAEARVIGHVPGNGKYVGKLGALLVEREDGAQFKVGSGFTDEERAHPPRIGSWITYAYNGDTNSGLPRFPRFVRVRHDLP